MGFTISKVANSLDELLEEFGGQVLEAVRRGFWPDSELIVIDPRRNTARIFKVDVKSHDECPDVPVEVGFEVVESGRAFHVGVAGRYGPHPDDDQIVGTIHIG